MLVAPVGSIESEGGETREMDLDDILLRFFPPIPQQLLPPPAKGSLLRVHRPNHRPESACTITPEAANTGTAGTTPEAGDPDVGYLGDGRDCRGSESSEGTTASRGLWGCPTNEESEE